MAQPKRSMLKSTAADLALRKASNAKLNAACALLEAEAKAEGKSGPIGSRGEKSPLTLRRDSAASRRTASRVQVIAAVECMAPMPEPCSPGGRCAGQRPPPSGSHSRLAATAPPRPRRNPRGHNHVPGHFPRQWRADPAYRRRGCARLPARPQAAARPPARHCRRVGALGNGRATLGSASRVATIHDFLGFPRALYELRYEPPGAPDIAEQASVLLRAAGLASALDARRGLHHGAWVPLLQLYPEADAPVLQVSVQPGFGPGRHLQLGRVLSPCASRACWSSAQGPSPTTCPTSGPPSWTRRCPRTCPPSRIGSTRPSRSAAPATC